MSRYEIVDNAAVMDRIPEIMGLDMTYNNGKWCGRYYLNGERHGWKLDKMQVRVWKGVILVSEQGGDTVSLQKWLVDYGACADYREANRVLRGAKPMSWKTSPIQRVREGKSGLFVSEGDIYTIEGDNDHNPLYCWLCRQFGEMRVKAAWERYGVGTDERGQTVYWYRDVDGNVCHDKVMRYCSDGHRDKGSGGAWRKFTTANGYTNRCLYGVHLLGAYGGRVYVVESEKTALMCSILWPTALFLATGGKGNVRDVDSAWELLPDLDAVEEWQEKGTVFRWWDKWPERTEHSDIGDMIESYVKAGREQELIETFNF